MTGAVLAQQADAGHIAGLWVGIALMVLGCALVFVGAGRIIRWWMRRGTSAVEITDHPARADELDAGPAPECSGGEAAIHHDAGAEM